MSEKMTCMSFGQLMDLSLIHIYGIPVYHKKGGDSHEKSVEQL